MTRINRLLAMAQIIEDNGQHHNEHSLTKAIDLLESSQETLRDTKESIRTWWTGALRDLVWRQIHMAETYIISMLPDEERQRRVVEILYDARFILDRDDPVMSTAAAGPLTVGGATPSPAEPTKPVFAYELVRRYREAWDDRYTASRGFRNRLIVLIAVVTFAVAVLITAGSIGMVWLDVAATPSHAILAPHLDDFLAMLTIAVLGAIGGLISGASEVVKVEGVYNPFSLPWYLLFFKIPMGALTGILGVLAIKGNLLPDMHLTMSNWSQVIIWALVFGASQQLITFMVDRRVRALSTSTPQEQVVKK
jgi:hypothetical protein